VQLVSGSGAGLAATSDTSRPRRADVPAAGDCEMTDPLRSLDGLQCHLADVEPCAFSVCFVPTRIRDAMYVPAALERNQPSRYKFDEVPRLG
jgi:hypothetical protein